MPKRGRRVTVSPVHIVLCGAGKLQIESAEDIGESCEKLRVRETSQEIVVSSRIFPEDGSKLPIVLPRLAGFLCSLELRVSVD